MVWQMMKKVKSMRWPWKIKKTKESGIEEPKEPCMVGDTLINNRS